MLDSLPNLRHLRAFCEVERQRSISRAADSVYLSQPAVTQAIAKLEATFGTPFFERAGAGVSAMPAAKAYAARVRRALAMMEAGAVEAVRLGGEKGMSPPKGVLALLTTTQLKAFVAVGTTNNFTLAGKLLGTSQASVHRATRDLESILDVMLFEKTTRGIVLTRAGETFWQQLKLAFSELNQGAADVRACTGERGGTLIIGCMPMARHFVMPETIVAFSMQFPEVHIQVIESPYPDLLHGLRHGEIDFLVGALRNPPPVDDVIQENLFSSRLVIAARPGHPLADRLDITLGELASFPWVLPPEGTPTRDRFDQLMSKHPEVRRFGLVESGSQVLIRGLLKGSDRLTLISTHQVQFEVETGSLVTLHFEIGDTPRKIGLTFRTDWQATAVQRDFLDRLRKVAHSYLEEGAA